MAPIDSSRGTYELRNRYVLTTCQLALVAHSHAHSQTRREETCGLGSTVRGDKSVLECVSAIANASVRVGVQCRHNARVCSCAQVLKRRCKYAARKREPVLQRSSVGTSQLMHTRELGRARACAHAHICASACNESSDARECGCHAVVRVYEHTRRRACTRTHAHTRICVTRAHA